ncbi:hypothetical protein EDD11_004239 [Mortierella claussenii]|nr:hypothetical protein EDD11_004239 [Mortierella claussenii]
MTGMATVDDGKQTLFGEANSGSIVLSIHPSHPSPFENPSHKTTHPQPDHLGGINASSLRNNSSVEQVFAEDVLMTRMAHITTPLQDQGDPSRELSLDPLQDQEGHQEQQAPLSTLSRRAKYWDLWIKNWFLLGPLAVIILAWYFPSAGKTGGPIRPDYSVKYGVTSCTFLLSDLFLQT